METAFRTLRVVSDYAPTVKYWEAKNVFLTPQEGAKHFQSNTFGHGPLSF